MHVCLKNAKDVTVREWLDYEQNVKSGKQQLQYYDLGTVVNGDLYNIPDCLIDPKSDFWLLHVRGNRNCKFWTMDSKCAIIGQLVAYILESVLPFKCNNGEAYAHCALTRLPVCEKLTVDEWACVPKDSLVVHEKTGVYGLLLEFNKGWLAIGVSLGRSELYLATNCRLILYPEDEM